MQSQRKPTKPDSILWRISGSTKYSLDQMGNNKRSTLPSSFYRKIIGVTFTGMGAITLLFPGTTLYYSLTPSSYLSITKGLQPSDVIVPEMKLMTQCFGAQATLGGIIILTSQFSKFTFKIFGLSMIPFYWFDYMAWSWGIISPLGAIGDAIGNTIFCVCSWMGYKTLERNHQENDSINNDKLK